MAGYGPLITSQRVCVPRHTIREILVAEMRSAIEGVDYEIAVHTAELPNYPDPTEVLSEIEALKTLRGSLEVVLTYYRNADLS